MQTHAQDCLNMSALVSGQHIEPVQKRVLSREVADLEFVSVLHYIIQVHVTSRLHIMHSRKLRTHIFLVPAQRASVQPISWQMGEWLGNEVCT